MKTALKLALIMGTAPLLAGNVATVLLPEYHTALASQEENHAGEESDDHGEENAVIMTAAERRAAGIETYIVSPRPLAEVISAPGEVTRNQYATSQVTPRLAAQVVARRVRMGDSVKAGQSLVTLSSVEMAAAQASLILAEKEWQRTRKLGLDVVSEQRHLEAQVGAQQAKAKLLAYGMSDAEIARLLSSGNAVSATGAFDLMAPQAGTVINDDFVVGQFIEPGFLLFAVSDEDHIWVEAQLAPDKAADIDIGSPAWVVENGDRMAATVVQVHHTVDEETRTMAVRVQMDNSADTMHAGEFVTVSIQTGEGQPVIAVPNEAILLLEGREVVFKRIGDELQPVPLVTGASKGGWTIVDAGLEAGDEIVIKQAFLIKSLILKSKMGEGHGH